MEPVIDFQLDESAVRDAAAAAAAAGGEEEGERPKSMKPGPVSMMTYNTPLVQHQVFIWGRAFEPPVSEFGGGCAVGDVPGL